MSMTRRQMLIQSGKSILLTGAAAIAWDFVLSGKVEAAPNYKVNQHWWAMLIDIDK